MVVGTVAADCIAANALSLLPLLLLLLPPLLLLLLLLLLLRLLLTAMGAAAVQGWPGCWGPRHLC
jgi:hypothetical protein